ncbi:MAG: alanine:cation symporter family protein, partial [Polyangiales bacterium]
FQANQSYAQVADVLPFFSGGWGALAYGVILAFLVGIVIIGGIRRIGQVAGFIVPIMCGIYLLAGFFIIFTNLDQVGPALWKIVSEAFTPKAGLGGTIGVLITGFRRAAFSNEAGVGSASIAHSAAATDEPVREGIVALLEPFIDTIIVCTMTGLVVVITGAYEGDAAGGVLMTSNAFATVLPWFPKVLSLAVFLFAFSTMISWSYYGERCWTFLFGPEFSMVYKVMFLGFVVFGSVLKLGNVIDFSDLMILGMSFPNILGAVLLSGKVRRALNDYWGRYKNGEMQPRG